MPADKLDTLLRILDALGPDPFLRCGCLDCLEVIEASINTDHYAPKEITA